MPRLWRFFEDVSLYPMEMLRIPMRLRTCRPEAGLISSLNRWTPFNLCSNYFKWNLFCSQTTTILRKLSYMCRAFYKRRIIIGKLHCGHRLSGLV